MTERPNEHARPFLKWAGGKRWAASQIAELIRDQPIETYYEPFLGGGAVFLEIAPARAILSDINPELIGTYKAVKRCPELVISNLEELRNVRRQYYSMRKAEPEKLCEMATRLIYLTSASWGGLYRVNKQGEFNVPFAGSGRNVCRAGSIRQASRVLRNAKARLLVSDFEDMIDLAKSGDVVYADPPYRTYGENNGFVRYNEKLFSWRDQERLAAAALRASRRGATVLVSSLRHPEVTALYKGWRRVLLRRACQVAAKTSSRGEITEVVFVSPIN